MGLSRTVFEINGDFSWNSQNFPTPAYFVPLLKGFPLELDTGTWGSKTRMMGLPGRERSLTISSAFWIQNVKWNVTDGRIDGQTDTGRQQRPRLRIASHVKNQVTWPTIETTDSTSIIYAYSLCHRTTKFDMVTPGGGVCILACHASHPKRAEFHHSPIFGILLYLCLHPLTHTCTHSVLTAIFSGEPGLAGCPLNSPSPFNPGLRILLGQA